MRKRQVFRRRLPVERTPRSPASPTVSGSVVLRDSPRRRPSIVARLTLDGIDLEVEAGAPLVEVIKESGTFISNLCYIDGLPPYAGCRTCLVEIEGARGLQLSCTTKVTDGMVVRSTTSEE